MALSSLANLPYFLVGVLKDILLVIVSLITIYKSSKSSDEGSHKPKFEDRLSPLLVAVPLHLIAESNKERLTVSKYSQLVLQSSGSCYEDCTVCLAVMKDHEEVRRLPNCGHVFHKDCIDAWIDECKSTCPVCRSRLLMDQGEKFKCGGDPWRRERMIYLFGEDYLL